MNIAILSAVVAAVLGGFWYLKLSSSRATRSAVPVGHEPRRPGLPYASVTIRCGKNACSDAKGLRRQKLLAAEAPPLPLPGCSAAACSCRYEKIDDRREENRRASDDGIEPVIFFEGNERRIVGDRRYP
jgi:hypothetical protein